MWPTSSPHFNLSMLQAMFHTTSTAAQLFNPTTLSPEDRVIYHLLSNFVNPIAGHSTSPGKIPLVYYYLFVHQVPIDWGFVVHSRLADTITDTQRNLPHAQFLTTIFNHFHVPIREQGVPSHPFELATLHRKHIRLHHDRWITSAEYVSEIQVSKPSPTGSYIPATGPSTSSSTDPSLASVLNELCTLTFFVQRLTNHVRYLEHGVSLVLPPEERDEFLNDRVRFGISDDDRSDSGSSGDDGDNGNDGDDVPPPSLKRPRA